MKGKMIKFRAAIIALTLTVMFFIPMSAIPDAEKAETETQEKPENGVSEKEEDPQEEKTEEAEGFFRIFDIETEEIKNVSFSDYVRGAIASEMGADFEYEALVAQGAAAFSCGLYQKNAHTAADYDFSSAPGKKLGYMTEEKAKEIYGEDFEEKWDIICSAEKEATEYVITYEGEPALTVYHACSNGMTESSENAWGGKVPYLVSVKSPGDALWKDFETTVKFSKKEVLEILNKNGAGLSGEYPEQWFEGAVLTEAGYVDYIEIGAATFSGERLRSLFGLRSAAFEAAFFDGDFVFSVKGYGHGVGLSQIGANSMAKNGANWKEIITHYYPGTEIIKYDEINENA